MERFKSSVFNLPLMTLSPRGKRFSCLKMSHGVELWRSYGSMTQFHVIMRDMYRQSID